MAKTHSVSEGQVPFELQMNARDLRIFFNCWLQYWMQTYNMEFSVFILFACTFVYYEGKVGPEGMHVSWTKYSHCYIYMLFAYLNTEYLYFFLFKMKEKILMSGFPKLAGE